ncbi:MAG: hypothetical protein B6I37_01270 [Desulfobacteraceae bacterium 4572_35.2]|nr:MAG: hypothetical protein B6I37_01270 [Desulfobacteraceae bacterium 4572_35.2]
MIDGDHLLIVFNSIHRVMVAEMVLKKKFDILVMPVPRAISADCGMVIRISDNDCAAIIEVLQTKGLAPFSTYRLRGERFELVGEFA